MSKPVERTATVTAAAIVDSWEGVDRGLFETLRGLRTRLALAASLPAYIVFSDATLRDLARRRPTDERLLRDVHGIGQQKAATYGADVLALIRDYCGQHQLEIESARHRANAAADKATSPAPRRWTLFRCSTKD